MPAYAGTDGDDTYFGDAIKADYVWVGSGNDSVYTYGGNDNVVSTGGVSFFYLGEGNDTLLSGVGNTLIYAGSGDDFIVDDGGAFYADQKFYLGSGNDQIVLRGSGETDIYGGAGNDTYVLLRYNDVRAITMGTADAIIHEDAGAAGGIDTIKLSTGWAGFVMAANVENLIADNTIAQDDRITWDNEIDDTVLGVEVTGNAAHNNILGSIVRDVLKGMAGSDTLDAYYGKGDKLYGGDGDDRLILSFARAAKMYGGAGDDTYMIRSWTTDAANSIVEYSNSGDDTLELRYTNVDLTRANLYAIENVTLSNDGAGTARVITGNGLSNTILTHVGNDTVTGGAGADEIRTAGGIDWLEGGLDNDTLDGGGDADRLYGGTGNDSLLAGSGDDWFYGGDGDDVMNAAMGVDFAYGEAGNDSIMGFAGDDFLYGGAGNDTVSGDGENDRVWGGAGNDKIYGGAGNDQLHGDAGVDLLYGGAGADRFIFHSLTDAPMTGLDRVMDFVKDSDKIDLSAMDADGTLSGNQAFHFNAIRPFFASAGDLNVSTNLLGTLVEGDVNGDGLSDFRILVVGNYALAASDFIL
jgi:Ca2+-binding RTX toxin-like protein